MGAGGRVRADVSRAGQRARGTMPRGARILVALALLLLGGAEAQERSAPLVTPAPERPGVVAPARGASYGEIVRRAELLLRQQQAEAAIGLLEPLRGEHPRDMRLIFTLARAYQAAGRARQGIDLLREAVTDAAGQDIGLWIELSRALEGDGEPEEAVRALLAGLRAHPEWSSEMVDRLELMAGDSLSGPSVLRTLSEAAASPEAPLAWAEVLGHLHAARGESEQALRHLMRVERGKRSDGRIVLRLAKTLARSDRPELAVAAYDSVLALRPADGTAEECLFEKAELLERWGRTAEAASALLALEERFPRGVLAPRAALKRAGLLLATGDPAGARALYEDLLARSERETRRDLRVMRDEIRLALAECALHQGEFAAAGETLADLAREAARAEIREQATFERAEALFYQGQAAEAEAAYYEVVDQFPSGRWVNDALARVLLLGEHGAEPAALAAYSQVAYQRRIGARDRALELCREGLAQWAAAPLGAALGLEEVRLLAQASLWTEADQALARLLVLHPRARWTAQALLLLGETGLAIPERAALARGYLERLVLDQPDVHEARLARGLLAEARKSDVHS